MNCAPYLYEDKSKRKLSIIIIKSTKLKACVIKNNIMSPNRGGLAVEVRELVSIDLSSNLFTNSR